MSYSQDLRPQDQIEDTPDLIEIKERYKKEGLIYHPLTEELRRNAFEWMKKQKPINEKTKKPESFMLNIDQILRVKLDNTENEYIMWHQIQYLKDNNGNDIAFDSYEGALPVVKTSKERNAAGQIVHSRVTGIKPDFKLKWSKENFNELISKSDFSTNQFIVGVAVDSYPECYTERKEYVYSIKSIDDFRDESFEVLMALGRSGLSSSVPSAHLIKDSMEQTLSDRISDPSIAKRVEVTSTSKSQMNNPQKKQ